MFQLSFPAEINRTKEFLRNIWVKRFFPVSALMLVLLLFASCSREKAIFEDNTFVSSAYHNGKDYEIKCWIKFKVPTRIELNHESVLKYGEVKISEREGNRSYFVIYALTNKEQYGDADYRFDAVCTSEHLLVPDTRGRRQPETISYIGNTVPATVTFDPTTTYYILRMGPVDFFSPNVDIETSFASGLDLDEARQASTSLLSNYLNMPVKLYPSKYLGDWLADGEGIILIVLLLLMVCAFIVGDWLSVIIIPIVAYLSLYTSYMVFLPFLPFLLLVPLSYIPGVPKQIWFVSGFSLLIGLYFVWLVYKGSTFWNAILLGFIWFMAIYLWVAYMYEYVYSKNFRCETCGRHLHSNYYDKSYIEAGRKNAVRAIPRSGFKSCSTVLDLKPKIQKGKVCFHCNL